MRQIPGVLSVLLLAWSLVTPWAAAFPGRPDHYKLTLFGVRHISDMTAQSSQVSCSWGELGTPCRPAATGESSYRRLIVARWLVLAALTAFLVPLLLRNESRRRRLSALFAMLGAGCLAGAIVLVHRNIASALAVFQGADIELPGPGMLVAGAAVLMGIVAAVAHLFVLRPRTIGPIEESEMA